MALKASDIVRQKGKKSKSSGVKGNKKNSLLDWIGARRKSISKKGSVQEDEDDE